MKIAGRASLIAPFYAMEVAKEASRIASTQGPHDPPMIHLTLGEPDFTAPPLVQQAASRAIEQAQTQYTPALGISPLREAVSHWYQQRFGLNVPASRIVITAGASAALQLACTALVDEGDEILMPDPCYPCNRHFVMAAGGTPVMIPTTAAERFQLSLAKVRDYWRAQTQGILVASPSNPTGTSVALDELRQIHQYVKAQHGVTIVDELYLGLSYNDEFGMSALSLDDSIISINSFSKYFSMTGWRLGWMVVPEVLVPIIERLAQNLFICPNAIAQYAALQCFAPASLEEYEQRRAEYRRRRDWFVPELNALGLTVPVMPDGAFYAWADCSAWMQAWGLDSSWDFTFELMKRCQVAVSPGKDFGSADTAKFVRFSTANSMENLQEAIRRLKQIKPV
ncbi:pyridoxal phosphate-dependent aminotransferase [Shewanella yunxiaonensis]|uniref:Aminotransferase n=1 Tax=Shewanella yunxiaonensis TaxID=2829809 RepID=A0ABX7YQY2_9GAMM|nr:MULTISPECIES: pyridoxal phosphate-dependent aminotransferase [Shewanella]MDF0534034.1 pyridoxal phosphate-dependent aminotransferase [Shewanella sp. A32]QUN05175.1 pyridoxal phosphate-dependent aminotransferase [Shewanella yunxiaonensis]